MVTFASQKNLRREIYPLIRGTSLESRIEIGLGETWIRRLLGCYTFPRFFKCEIIHSASSIDKICNRKFNFSKFLLFFRWGERTLGVLYVIFIVNSRDLIFNVLIYLLKAGEKHLLLVF